MLDLDHPVAAALLKACKEADGDSPCLVKYKQDLLVSVNGLCGVPDSRTMLAHTPREQKFDIMNMTRVVRDVCGIEQCSEAYPLVTPTVAFINQCRKHDGYELEVRQAALNCGRDLGREGFVVPHIETAEEFAGTCIFDTGADERNLQRTGKALGDWLAAQGGDERKVVRLGEMLAEKQLMLASNKDQVGETIVAGWVQRIRLGRAA